ncbi:MAG: PfkB family carbohydrate kinase [Planctomycetota bacterium]
MSARRRTNQNTNYGPSGKILSPEALDLAREEARRDGRRVVQCHGCFDIVHPGHIRHLRFAKAQGDILLVSITGDQGISKGTGRPLIPQELRAENLAALDFVDWITIDPSPTASGLLGRVRPDVYVKGREYETNEDPRFMAERDLVERHGGRVVFSSGDVVFSSTALIHAMETAVESSLDPYARRITELSRLDELSGERLFGVISAFRGKRAVVVGETILDTYVFCDQPGVAGESPVMTLRPLEKRHYDGGAAIVARHLAALGAHPVLVTALPMEGEAGEVARQLKQRLVAEGIEVRAVPIDGGVAEKQRFLVGAQKVMKLDLVEPISQSEAQRDTLIASALDAASEGPGTDLAVIADFGLGLLTRTTLERLSTGLRPLVRTFAGDVSGARSGLLAMHNLDLVCPSETELREALRRFDEGLPAAAWDLFQSTGVANAIVTMGPEGCVAFDRLSMESGEAGEGFTRRLRAEHIPALAPHAIDALGCGDALLSVAGLTLSAGGSITQAAFLGAVGASIQSQRLGNLPIAAAELRRGLARMQAAHLTFAAPEVVAARGTAPTATAAASGGN